MSVDHSLAAKHAAQLGWWVGIGLAAAVYADLEGPAFSWDRTVYYFPATVILGAACSSGLRYVFGWMAEMLEAVRAR